MGTTAESLELRFWTFPQNRCESTRQDCVFKTKQRKTRQHVAGTAGVPCRRKWPQVDIDPMTAIEGLKLMYIHEFRGHPMKSAEVACWWEWPFDHCDPKWPKVDLWLHNIRRSQAHVWVLWSCYVTWTSCSIFLWKSRFDPDDPKWPQIDIWPYKIGRGYLADAYAWVLWICCVTWTSKAF